MSQRGMTRTYIILNLHAYRNHSSLGNTDIDVRVANPCTRGAPGNVPLVVPNSVSALCLILQPTLLTCSALWRVVHLDDNLSPQ